MEDLRTRLVRFKIRDIYIPDPEVLLMELHSNDVLQGRVLDLSDAGVQQGAFAVVEVEGLRQPVIVPVSRICDVSS
jgi:hypothetical protein